MLKKKRMKFPIISAILIACASFSNIQAAPATITPSYDINNITDVLKTAIPATVTLNGSTLNCNIDTTLYVYGYGNGSTDETMETTEYTYTFHNKTLVDTTVHVYEYVAGSRYELKYPRGTKPVSASESVIINSAESAVGTTRTYTEHNGYTRTNTTQINNYLNQLSITDGELKHPFYKNSADSFYLQDLTTGATVYSKNDTATGFYYIPVRYLTSGHKYCLVTEDRISMQFADYELETSYNYFTYTAETNPPTVTLTNPSAPSWVKSLNLSLFLIRKFWLYSFLGWLVQPYELNH